MMMTTIRSVLFTVIMFLSVIPHSLLVVFGRLFGAEVAYSLVVLWARGIIGLCVRLCKLNFVVEGKENLPEQNSVVLMKHSSTYETIAEFLFFPRQCWVLKREIMWAPFLGWGVAAVHPIAINRGAGRSAVEQVIEQGKKKLDNGIWVMIFPEGTRMAPGKTRRYGISGALLAQKTGRLLVPVAHNAGDFWPRRGWIKRPGTVRFCIGPPVDPAGRDLVEVNQEIQDWIENKVAEIRAGESQPG